MNVPDIDALRAALDDLDARGKQVDQAIVACPAFPAPEAAKWHTWYAGYLAFASASRASMGSTLQSIVFPSTFVAALNAIQAQIASDEIDLAHFVDETDSICHTDIANKPPAPGPIGLDYLKWGTYLAVGLGGLYLLGTFGPGFAGLLPASRRRRR